MAYINGKQILFSPNLHITEEIKYNEGYAEGYANAEAITSGLIDRSITGKVVIPQEDKSIGSYAFANCAQLESVIFHSEVNAIKGNAFFSCINAKLYDFRKHIAVPSLASNSFYSSTVYPFSALIIVPYSLYAEWIAATNWSTWADNIASDSYIQCLNYVVYAEGKTTYGKTQVNDQLTVSSEGKGTTGGLLAVAGWVAFSGGVVSYKYRVKETDGQEWGAYNTPNMEWEVAFTDAHITTVENKALGIKNYDSGNAYARFSMDCSAYIGKTVDIQIGIETIYEDYIPIWEINGVTVK